MPATVSESMRPRAMAGLAKLVELVKVGGADVGADGGWYGGCSSGAGEGEDHEQQSQGGDHLGERVCGGGAV